MADAEKISEQEENIYIILTYMHKAMSEPHLSSKQTKTVKELVSQLLEFIEKLANPDNHSDIIQIYEVLLNIDKKNDFCRVYGDNRLRILLHYNIAYCYQDPKHNNISKTLFHIENSLEEYLYFLKLKEGLESYNAQNYLRLNKFSAQVCLQTAAMYGVQGYSDRAVYLAGEAFNYIGNLVENLKAYYCSCKTNEDKRHYQLTTFFRDFKAYYDHLKNIKTNPTKSAMKATKVLNWEYNPQNNEKFFTQSNYEYDPELKFYADFIKDHNIGDIMFLSLINEGMFEELSYEELVESDDFIIEIILLFACSLYTLSTEKRVISTINEEKSLKGYQSNRIYNLSQFNNDYGLKKDNGSAVDAKRAISLGQNNSFMESEFYMKKCLELLNRYLKQSMLFNIVLTQYHRYYPKVVNYITEEEEPSQTYSVLFTERKDKKSVINEEENSTSNIIINNINITHNNCNIDPTKNFKKKKQETAQKSNEHENIELTPIKTSINDLSNNENMAKDLNNILNDLKTSPTLEPRTSQESNNIFLSEVAPVPLEKDEKAKAKNLLSKKGYLSKNAKMLKELIESQKDDIVMKRLKNVFTHKKQPTIDDIKKALAVKNEDKKIGIASKLTKHKSQDVKQKAKDMIRNNMFIHQGKKASFAIPHKTLKLDMTTMHQKKYKDIFTGHNRSPTAKVLSPRFQVNFHQRKNSPLQTDRKNSAVGMLRKYRTVDLTQKNDTIDESNNIKSPRRNGAALDIRTIKANLKNSTMKSSRSMEKKKIDLKALKSIDDYRCATLEGECLSSRRELRPKSKTKLTKEPRNLSSQKLLLRPNQKQ